VGTEVTITGTDLLHVTAVKFANNQSAAFIIDSNTQIRATVPAGAVRGSIRVESAGGAATSLNRFTVTP
jgi:N-acetylmuramic acid 6-phosphate (MurNAc-6-P) etherase